MIARLSKLIGKLKDREYRAAYVEENVRTGIAFQVRALRSQRGWTQKKLAEVMGKPQSVVCRIEDPDYGKLSVQTLLEVAAAFDVALVIQYVGFPEFLRRTRDVSPDALGARSFEDDYRSEAKADRQPEAPPLGPIQNITGGGRTRGIDLALSPPPAYVIGPPPPASSSMAI